MDKAYIFLNKRLQQNSKFFGIKLIKPCNTVNWYRQELQPEGQA